MPIQLKFPFIITELCCIFCQDKINNQIDLYGNGRIGYKCFECEDNFDLETYYSFEDNIPYRLAHVSLINEFYHYDMGEVFNTLWNRQTNQKYDLTHNLVLEPSDFTKIDTILLLL